jgi:hypothetical protein
MRRYKPLSPEIPRRSIGFIGAQAGLLLILLALIAHVSYLVGRSYEIHPIVFAVVSTLVLLPPLAYLSVAAHYNNIIFFAIVAYGVVHVAVLPGTPYMLTVAESMWWIGAGSALAGYGVLAYRFIPKKGGAKTPPHDD